MQDSVFHYRRGVHHATLSPVLRFRGWNPRPEERAPRRIARVSKDCARLEGLRASRRTATSETEPAAKMSTITNDCTRRWTINHPPSLNRTWRGLGVIHKSPRNQQTQQLSSFRVSVEGCTPTGARCKQQERNRLPVKGEIYREPSSSIWTG
jgi:hypothetical protein